ncbi:hypothetical protein [Cardiobacterium valvarum]|uniref:hypothetical protein n=1 Tax=Cardiobacterium valvarum TaxID=194702 RepID=UPI0035E816CE
MEGQGARRVQRILGGRQMGHHAPFSSYRISVSLPYLQDGGDFFAGFSFCSAERERYEHYRSDNGPGFFAEEDGKQGAAQQEKRRDEIVVIAVSSAEVNHSGPFVIGAPYFDDAHAVDKAFFCLAALQDDFCDVLPRYTVFIGVAVVVDAARVDSQVFPPLEEKSQRRTQ